MKFVVKQLSGLGNQLFQYAAGAYYADRFAGSFEIAHERPQTAFSHGFPRPFLLARYNITASIRPQNKVDQLICEPSRRYRILSGSLRRMYRAQVVREDFKQRYLFKPDLEISSSANRIYLLGYWQTFKIVDAMSEKIRREFTLKDPAKGENRHILEKIRNAEHSVAIHFRRGDYTLAAEGNPALSIAYYRNAIRGLKNEITDPLFFVFSDEVEFAREKLKDLEGAVFVGHNDSYSAHEDLRLMAACNHQIIANSTFSWWAAWLNSHPKKMVCAPDRWLESDAPHTDLLPPEWRIVSSL